MPSTGKCNVTKYLTEASVLEVYSMKGKCSAVQLAAKFNVSAKTVRWIWSGHSWSHVTGAQKPQKGGKVSCLQCKKEKVRCDMERPCRRCVNQGCGDTCCTEDPGQSKAEAERAIQQARCEDGLLEVERLPLTSYNSVLATYKAGPLGPETPESGILTKLMHIGANYDELSCMFHSLPSRLRWSLLKLSEKVDRFREAARTQGSKLRMVPEKSSEIWSKSSTMPWVGGRFTREGTNISISPGWANFAGFHKEEALARMAQKDMPICTSEYRNLCNGLERMLAHIQASREAQPGEVPRKTVYALGRWRHGVGEPEPVLMRCTFTFYADGVQLSVAFLRPEEYTAAMQSVPDLKGVFLECDMSGEELCSGAADIWEQERISNMMQTVEGQQKLERLAERVAQLFEIDARATRDSSDSPSTHNPTANPCSELLPTPTAAAPRRLSECLLQTPTAASQGEMRLPSGTLLNTPTAAGAHAFPSAWESSASWMQTGVPSVAPSADVASDSPGSLEAGCRQWSGGFLQTPKAGSEMGMLGMLQTPTAGGGFCGVGMERTNSWGEEGVPLDSRTQ